MIPVGFIRIPGTVFFCMTGFFVRIKIRSSLRTIRYLMSYFRIVFNSCFFLNHIGVLVVKPYVKQILKKCKISRSIGLLKSNDRA